MPPSDKANLKSLVIASIQAQVVGVPANLGHPAMVHVEACLAGLANGTIDAISSGHAPRASEKKMQDLDAAPFGMVSLETTLAMVVTYLIQPNKLDWSQAIAKLSTNPAKILGIHKGTLRIGAEADLVIIDPDLRWKVDRSKFQSRSSNTPLLGRELCGKATHTFVNGELRYSLPTNS